MEKKTPSGYKILSTSFCPTAPVTLTRMAQLLIQSSFQSYLLPNIITIITVNSQSIARKTNTHNAYVVYYAFSSLFYQNMMQSYCFRLYYSMKQEGLSRKIHWSEIENLDWPSPSSNLRKGSSLLQLLLRWQSLQVLACKGEFPPASAWGK